MKEFLELAETQIIFEQFSPLGFLVQMEYLLRILVAAVLGLVIGSERKNRNKSAGIRTHAIVALGAALMMVVSKYGFCDVEKGDAARLAAQVVSGIGFLGAGVIFVRNNLVSGLTTAAGMWATAGVGLAMGAGMYILGIASTILMIGIQFLMHKIHYFADVACCGMIHMTIEKEPDAVNRMEKFLEAERVEIASLKINKVKKEEIKLEFDVVYPPGYDRHGLLAKLAEKDVVIAVRD